MLVDPDGEEPDHVLVDVRLALELGDRGRRSIEVESDVVRLAVLGDAVGEAAQAPGLGLYDLPAIVFDDLSGVFRERIDLGLGEVLTREENMLVERHASCSLSWPIADAAQCGRPSGCRSKITGAAAGPCASGAHMAKHASKGKPAKPACSASVSLPSRNGPAVDLPTFCSWK